MTAYDWPDHAGGGPPDDRRGRRGWNFDRGLRRGGEVLPDPEPPHAPAPGRGAGRKAAPTASADLWQPIGPLAVLGGQAEGKPRVTGRVMDVWVEPSKGMRAYAAAATGGVWYTDDGATSWRAIGGWRPADPTATNVSANPLATGCLWVEWGRNGNTDDPTKDDVWAGTGDANPSVDGTPGDHLPGIGILRAQNPAGKPETDPVFTAEATNLLGAGVFRLARQPAGGDMAAATTKGLLVRPAGAAPVATWNAPEGVPKSGDKTLVCTDVVWTPAVGTQKARLWASMLRTESSNATELWWRADGDNTFHQVTLPLGPTGATPRTRLNLAASPTGDTVWALGHGPRVWRVDATVDLPVGRLVTNMPDLWDGAKIHETKIAVAVDPSAPARIALGGTTAGSGAALFLGAVTSPAANQFRYPNGAGIGDDVHADVTSVRFTNDGKQVWVSCDGGVFVSMQSGAAGTFVSRNGGLAIIEAGFVASHPTNDAAVVIGVQDNATQRRVGESLWRRERGGDGGGIAFDQIATHRYVAQYINTDWKSGTTPPTNPPIRRTGQVYDDEDKAASFYSMPATIANGAKNQLVVGSDRVWYTDDWGTKWVTVPTRTDPRGAAIDPVQDVLQPDGGGIRVLRWVDPNRLWALHSRSLYQLSRNNAGTWQQPPTQISLKDVLHPASSTDVSAEDLCNDIAVHDPARGTTGSLFLAMRGDLSADGSDQLWWYDGSSKWFRTGLRKKTTASALAVAVEPGHLDTVYAGTSIGVFRTTITFNGNDPVFAPWTRLDNGLPDAAVQDLSVFSVGPIRLLRAATQARGVWELDLTGPVADRAYVRVHEYDTRRTSPTSLDAPFVAKIADPAHAGQTVPVPYSWHASPDVRAHPKLGAMAPPSSLPWTKAKPRGASGDPFGVWRLWRFQTALRNVDRRSEPTGTWDDEFDAVVRANGVPTPGGKATIDKPFWQSIVTAPNLTRTPWDGPGPTEADLVEYLPTETTSLTVDFPSVTLPLGTVTVEVLVHHRGFPAAPAGDVQVTLLHRLVPKWHGKKSVDWVPGAVGWTAAIAAFLQNGTNPALPAGWKLSGTTTQRVSTSVAVAAGAPQAVSFDVDLATGIKTGTLAILVAVVHTTADAVALSEVPLRQLTLDRRHVAVRSVLLR